MTQISAFAKVFNGKTPARADQRKSGHPVLKIKDVDKHGAFKGEFESFVEQQYANEFEDKFVKLGDILILNAAHNADYVGSKVYRAEEAVYGSLPTGEWLLIRPEGNLNPSFAYHWVINPRTRKQMRELVKGIHLYPKDVARLSVSFPPLEEQRRIAEVLDKADALRQKRRLALQKLDTLLQSVFLEMFGDPTKNQTRWKTLPLGELGQDKNAIVDGPFGSSINVADDYLEFGEIPVIRTKNVHPFKFVTEDLKFISRAKFETVRRSEVKPGDIVLTKVGTIGNVCIFPDTFPEALLSTTGSCRIRPNGKIIDTIFLAYFLHFFKPEMLRFAAQGVQAFLNMTHIKSFRIALPPLKLQRDFASRVERINQLRHRLENGSIVVDRAFHSIQQQAFNGELFG